MNGAKANQPKSSMVNHKQPAFQAALRGERLVRRVARSSVTLQESNRMSRGTIESVLSGFRGIRKFKIRAPRKPSVSSTTAVTPQDPSVRIFQSTEADHPLLTNQSKRSHLGRKIDRRLNQDTVSGFRALPKKRTKTWNQHRHRRQAPRLGSLSPIPLLDSGHPPSRFPKELGDGNPIGQIVETAIG